MGILLVSAQRSRSGKTSLIAALLTQSAAEGRRVAYFKPFSASPGSDSDVSFISDTVLANSGSPPIPVPLSSPADDIASTLLNESQGHSVKQSLADIQQAADLVLIEAPDTVSPAGAAWSLPAELANLLDCPALLVFPYASGLTSQSVLNAADPFTTRLTGLVINGVTNYRKRQVENELVSQLRAAGKTVFGTIPEDRTMIGVTVAQIAQQLGGRWVQDPVNTDACIDRFLLGGNIMDSGETYYGRFANQAVIVRAERPDIQMASLMEDTKCLVLTGGSEPTEYVKAEALQRDVPLISVTEDTMSIAESLGGLLDQANPYSQHKVDRYGELMRLNLDMAALSAVLNA